MNNVHEYSNYLAWILIIQETGGFYFKGG